MKFFYSILILVVLSTSLSHSHSMSDIRKEWDGLKVTFGINPFDSNSFVSLPRTEADARAQGWQREKNCTEVLGNRWIKNGDRAVIVIFNANGNIAGLAVGVPKGLPFNFPSQNIRRFFNDEGSFYSISAYFMDPATVCVKQAAPRLVTGDRLVFKSKTYQLEIPRKESDVKLSNLWTYGQCFFMMGNHYWGDISGIPLTANMNVDDFIPFFLQYNKGQLIGFGWAFNYNELSPRFEHPVEEQLVNFFPTGNIPSWMSDPNRSGILSTLHVYMDNAPQFISCPN